MANSLGYELVKVGTTAIGPTAAIVQGGVASAVFHLSPDAPCDVRWRPDGGLTGTNHALPTALNGGPIKPGGQIVVVGEGNIRNARFISTTQFSCELHCYYFDRVDVVQVDLSGSGAADMKTSDRILRSLVSQNQNLLYVLLSLHNGLALSGVIESEPIENLAVVGE